MPDARSAHLIDVFRHFGRVTVRRMFGGYGVYHDGLMFALAADDVLYLKADAESVARFEAEGMPPFAYEANGRTMRMSYYQAPAEVLEDPAQAAEWAQLAYAAALRARAARKPKRSPKRSPKR
jgi:DNA transformation protein and related proteins